MSWQGLWRWLFYLLVTGIGAGLTGVAIILLHQTGDRGWLPMLAVGLVLLAAGLTLPWRWRDR